MGAGALLAWAAVGMAFAQAKASAPDMSVVRPAVDQAYTQLLAAPQVQQVLSAVKADHARTTEDLKLLNEIPAPPFQEQRRAEAFLARLHALGLPQAYIDDEGNVVGLRPGTNTSTNGQAGRGPLLVVSAHLDTVFPEGTDVTVKERGGRLHAPGVADNARGLAVLLSWLKVLQDQELRTVGDLLFVASVGEEELGNLRGMKHLFAQHPDIDGMVGLEPAPDGVVLAKGTASRRYEVRFHGPGGHSYAAFGRVPSAVHGMGRAIARIAELKAPAFPRTTFTVGTVAGGTSVNTIASEARMTIDIRAEQPGALRRMERRILAAIDAAVADENRRWQVQTLRVEKRLIGERPGGRTPSDSVIVEAATRANAAFGQRTLLGSGSTDANLPMSLGIPAIVIGAGGASGGFHALDEWIDLTHAWKGAQNGLLTVLGLVGVEGVSAPLLEKRLPVLLPLPLGEGGGEGRATMTTTPADHTSAAPPRITAPQAAPRSPRPPPP